MFDITSDKVYVETFGGSNLYYQGELIYFSSGKAKELLTILVDRNGKEITSSYLVEILNKGERDETVAKQAAHLAQHRLKQTSKKYGTGKIIIKSRRTHAINKETVVCDSYDMAHQVKRASSFFVGEYMPEYGWAGVTLPDLVRDHLDEGELQGAYNIGAMELREQNDRTLADKS